MPKRRKVAHRCVNCGINLFYGVPYTELSLRVRSVLQQWIPSHDLKESMLCRECNATLNTSEEVDAGAPAPVRLLGHSQVCRMCGRSAAKVRKYYSLEGRHGNPAVARVLEEIAANPPKNFECHETQSKEYMTLSKYRRVRGTQASCAVAGCRVGGAARSPLSVRRRLLQSRRLYLPGGTRLCPEHCQPDADLTPLFQRKLSHYFSDQQIADMLFLIKPFPPALDADNVEAMNQHLRRIWLGVTWEEFLATMRQNPSIPPRALAIRLCAETRGECPEVMSSLFQLPREKIDEALRITGHMDHKRKPATPPSGDSDKLEANATTEVQLNDSSLKDVLGKAPTPQAMDDDTM